MHILYQKLEKNKNHKMDKKVKKIEKHATIN